MLTTTTLFALGSVALFFVGVGSGWLLKKIRGPNNPSVQTAIALLITVVWVVSIAAEIVVPAYTVSMMLHGIMGAVVGYLFSEDGITINIGAGE